MGLHTANASPNFPFFLQTASVRLSQPPTKVQEEFGKYLASINLSSGKTWPYKLQTQSRPTGKSTQVIITTYDLPDQAAPHDTLRDKDGQCLVLGFPASVHFETGPEDRQGHALSGSHIEARVSDRRPDDHDG